MKKNCLSNRTSQLKLIILKQHSVFLTQQSVKLTDDSPLQVNALISTVIFIFIYIFIFSLTVVSEGYLIRVRSSSTGAAVKKEARITYAAIGHDVTHPHGDWLPGYYP